MKKSRKSTRESTKRMKRLNKRKYVRKSARKSPRKSARKTARKSTRRSTRKSTRRSTRKSTRRSTRRSTRKSTKRYNGKQMGGVNPSDIVGVTNSQEVTSLLIEKAGGVISEEDITQSVKTAMEGRLTFQLIEENFNRILTERLIPIFNKRAGGVISEKDIQESLESALEKGKPVQKIVEKFNEILTERNGMIAQIVAGGYDRSVTIFALEETNYNLEKARGNLEELKQQHEMDGTRDRSPVSQTTFSQPGPQPGSGRVVAGGMAATTRPGASAVNLSQAPVDEEDAIKRIVRALNGFDIPRYKTTKDEIRSFPGIVRDPETKRIKVGQTVTAYMQSIG